MRAALPDLTSALKVGLLQTNPGPSPIFVDELDPGRFETTPDDIESRVASPPILVDELNPGGFERLTDSNVVSSASILVFAELGTARHGKW